MAEQNEKRFDINPHVIRQLGEELVPNDITALMELVKNAYDADSPYVKIDINTKDSYTEDVLEYSNNKGYIVIEDAGFGMDEETIIKSWLTISYSKKRANRNGVKPMTPKGRTPLGDKGLGRLSTQRLADCCEIFTSVPGVHEKLHVAFDWRDFDNVEQLSKVPVVFRKQLSNKGQGTKLILTNLHNPNAWEGDSLAALKGDLTQLISPFAENRPFYVYLTVNGELINIIQEFSDLLDVALASYQFNFNGNILTVSGVLKAPKLIGNSPDTRENYRIYIEPDNGEKFVNYFFDKVNDSAYFIPKTGGIIAFKKEFSLLNDIAGLNILEGQICNPGAFYGCIYDFALNDIREGDESIFDSFSEYKSFVQQQTGIKIYRDGFSVFPYGFGDNDWLGLRTGQTSGSSFYGLRPDNTIGYFAISEGINTRLKEKTDRTGFISNGYTENFTLLAKDYIVKECNRFVEKVRRTYNLFLSSYKQENSKVKTLSEAFSLMRETGDASAKIYKEIGPIKEEFKTIQNKTKEIYDRKTEISLFTTKKDDDQEISHLLLEIQTLLKKANELISSVERILKYAQLLENALDIIKPKIGVLEQQLQDFSELASVGLTAESITHELGHIIERLLEQNRQFKQKIEKSQLNDKECRLLSEYINTAINGLRIQLKHIDPALRYTREYREKLTLKEFFEQDELSYYQNSFSKNNIEARVICKSPFSIYINKGRFIQIIDNLINNSLYWIKERVKKEPTFQPILTFVIDKPWIYIYDNGYGVATAVEDSLFEPFVTMKPKGTGRGLGLFIIMQLLDAVGCSIVLERKRNAHNKRYIFAINLSNVIK